jgi:Tfp pilus assembly protein PilN
MSHELNLLPPERRRLLDRQSLFVGIMRALHNGIVGLSIITACGIATSIALWSIVFMDSGTVSAELDQEVEQYQRRRADIARQNVVLERMHELSVQRMTWSSLLHEMFPVLPAGTTIRQINGRAGQNMQLTFTGQAVNRNAVIIMSNRLEALPWVADVEAPHTNLLQRVDPSYSFTLSIRNPNGE